MATKRHFVPNGNYVKAFYTPGGQTGRWLKREAKRVEFVSKTYVGKGGTGRLAKSIRAGKVTKDGPLELEVYVRANARKRGDKTSYALAHHEGSGPHVIRAKNGGYLHWGGRGGPMVVAVIHPGSKGTYYLLRALNLVVGGFRAERENYLS